MAISLQDISNFKNSRNRIALFEALQSSDAGIREAALIALIEIEDMRDVEKVKNHLITESDIDVLKQVLPVLHTSKLYNDSDFLYPFVQKTSSIVEEVKTNPLKHDKEDGNATTFHLQQETKMLGTIKERQSLLKILAIVFLISALVSLIFMADSPFAYRVVYFIGGLLFGAIAIILFVFARKKSTINNEVANHKEDIDAEDGEGIERNHFTRLFHHRDIFAMGILYEGELPQDISMTPSMIAREVVLALHQENRFIDDRLSFHAVIKMERVASYKFFNSEDYNPGSDLDDLMRLCMDDVKKMVVTDDPLIEKIAAQMSKVKVRIPTLGVVWVGMYISMI
ncbi:MAG: hypothetical protein CVU94_00180 [Firmicutes bacterium HGW-Firmicutes-19]|jgi:hypothetical protein|nr:MAG: hypothetical protein CVU94_00180 [Firmicutes bacterium HGW-Firmicutes-19]